MKIKKSHLKELIRQSIVESWWDNLSPDEQAAYIKKHPGSQKAKDAKDAEDDVGGPAYPNVPKGAKSSKQAKQMSKLPFEPDPPKKGDDSEMDAGGPSYANVPKGAKTSAQAKGMKQAQDLAKSAIPKPSDDIEKNMMDASKKANKKMEIDVLNKKAAQGNGDLIDTEYNGMVTWVDGDPNEDSFIATTEDGEDVEIDYTDIIRFHNDDKEKMKNLNLESVRRRTTVKEVQKWMKGLEENRYKKVYNSDCRRISWMVNNMGENVENMPKSMRKKWTKAQYGRERQLATEFIKHLDSKQLQEQKLRKLIRNIIKETLKKKVNEGPRDFIHHSEAKFLKVWKSHANKAQKLLKKFKWQVEFDTKHKSGYIGVRTTKKVYDDVLEILMNNNIKVRG